MARGDDDTNEITLTHEFRRGPYIDIDAPHPKS